MALKLITLNFKNDNKIRDFLIDNCIAHVSDYIKKNFGIKSRFDEHLLDTYYKVPLNKYRKFEQFVESLDGTIEDHGTFKDSEDYEQDRA